jgi:hypothetical protein
MSIRLYLGVVAIFSLGCSPSTKDSDTLADGWWDDPAEGDEEEPDDFDDEAEGGLMSLEWTVDLASGTGIFDGSHGGCKVYGEVVNAMEIDTCSACSLGMSITYESLNFSGEGCETLQEMEDITDRYGHSKQVIGEYDGYMLHALYMIDEDDNWVEVVEGYSLIFEDIWYFGIDL